jgi:signal recognition particle GTPase
MSLGWLMVPELAGDTGSVGLTSRNCEAMIEAIAHIDWRSASNANEVPRTPNMRDSILVWAGLQGAGKTALVGYTHLSRAFRGNVSSA